jgi:hypothetical protein
MEHRPMHKITLRDLFAAVTIVALALGWLVDHRRQENNYEWLVQELKDQDAYIGMGREGNPTIVWPVFQRLSPEDAAILEPSQSK